GYKHTTFNPSGVMVEKGNILKVVEVLLRIRGSFVLWQVALRPVEREFFCHDFFTKGDTLLLLRGRSRYLVLDVLEAFL
ncbi:UNVERIFIED_CONTAM: hypothetical protein Sindi_2494500, partial [Sesamum indicum]